MPGVPAATKHVQVNTPVVTNGLGAGRRDGSTTRWPPSPRSINTSAGSRTTPAPDTWTFGDRRRTACDAFGIPAI